MHDQKKNNKPFSENVAVISCICMTKRIPSHKMNKNACLMTLEAKKIELRWCRKTMSDCLPSGLLRKTEYRPPRIFPFQNENQG